MITMPFMMGARAKEEVWEITVNTEATTTGAKTTGIPISLYNQPGITLTVDWGDGTNSVLTQASYSEGNYTPSTHEYATPGTYTVQMKSTKWGKLYVDTLNSSSTGTLTHLQNFRSTVIAVGIFPKIQGSLYRTSDTSSPNFFSNSLISCFQSCSNLASIPAGLFNNNTAVTNFGSCFQLCPNLTSIPAGLFDNNTSVTSFGSCFQSCPNLTSIPAGLFDNNTAVTSFYGCFQSCSNLTSIPAGLFDNNTAVTSFGRCFYSCSSLSDFTLKIVSPSVSNASSFVTLKSGTTRTIYVPSGSTTENTFNSVADSLGLTIIGE